MKTTSKIFAVFFLVLGSVAAWYAYNGAHHQWFVCGLCTIMTLVLLDDAYNDTESNEKVNL